MGGVEVSLMGGSIPPRSRNSVRFEDMQGPPPKDGTYMPPTDPDCAEDRESGHPADFVTRLEI